MEKRIFRYMSLIIVVTVVSLAALWGLLLERQLGTQAREGLRSLRVSLIRDDGAVIFDNLADTATLDNHQNRPEVIAARQSGTGESERFSDTFGEKSYYYATKTADGNIVRFALTVDSINALILRYVPVFILCLLLVLLFSFFTAKRLTRRVVEPINTMNLDRAEIETYDELSPFVARIEAQKKEIFAQIQALKDRADVIAAITQNMKEGLILTDDDGVILSANRSALDIFDTEDAAGKTLLHICRNLELLQKNQQCLAGESAALLLERNQKMYSVFLNPVHTGNTVTGALLLFLDVTLTYDAERHRQEFSANVSHELKTPLTMISALAEMIENGMAQPEDIPGFAVKISAQSKRLLHIIDNIIRLSAFDEGRAFAEYSSFDLGELAESVIDSLQDSADEKQVRLTVTGEHFSVNANERMFDELLYNLVDNGIKYNQTGGSVIVTLSRKDDSYKITVADTGIGIPPEHIHRVCERFYRVDKSRSQKTGGTGLGLSIVKHIVEYHHGQLETESVLNQGTTISCFFRL